MPSLKFASVVCGGVNKYNMFIAVTFDYRANFESKSSYKSNRLTIANTCNCNCSCVS